MPRLIDRDLRTADLVIGVNRVLATHGIPGLTMRMIARESGISTGSLMHHFETRERILRIAAHRTGRTLISAAESDSYANRPATPRMSAVAPSTVISRAYAGTGLRQS